MVKAATPLHKAMKYETTQVEMPPVMVVSSTPDAFVYDDYMRIMQTRNTCVQNESYGLQNE